MRFLNPTQNPKHPVKTQKNKNMAGKTRLTKEIIERIIPLIKRRATKKDVCHIIGVTDQTFRNWVKRGYERRTGIEWELVCAIEKADAETCDAYAKIVETAALEGKVIVTEKQIRQKDGTFLTVEKNLKREPADEKVAFKFLERARPELWAERKYMQVDWRSQLKQQGVADSEISEHERQIDSIITGIVEGDDE